MPNPVIKFSHSYSKLVDHSHWDRIPIKNAKLLQVVPIEISTLSKTFLNYDTDNGKYALGFSGWYLMLIFQKPSGDLFTTLRTQFNQRGDKRPYYDSLVGKEFDIVITQ